MEDNYDNDDVFFFGIKYFRFVGFFGFVAIAPINK